MRICQVNNIFLKLKVKIDYKKFGKKYSEEPSNFTVFEKISLCFRISQNITMQLGEKHVGIFQGEAVEITRHPEVVCTKNGKNP